MQALSVNKQKSKVDVLKGSSLSSSLCTERTDERIVVQNNINYDSPQSSHFINSNPDTKLQSDVYIQCKD